MSNSKTISVKFLGSNRPAETLSIEAGSSARDVLQTLGLGTTDYQLVNPAQGDHIFNLNENLFAAIEDGDLIAATAKVDAGLEVA